MVKNTPDPWSKIPLIHVKSTPNTPDPWSKIPLILMFVNIHIVLEPQMSWNWTRILLIVGRCDEQPSFPGDLLIQKNTTESEYFSTQKYPSVRGIFGPKNTPQ